MFDNWADAVPKHEYISHVENVGEYEPGYFYKRELPCILKLLNEHRLQPDIIVIDGYVYLDGSSQPGLGKHLFDAVDQSSEIIGVAKRSFSGISSEYEVFRGDSEKPLFITASSKLTDSKAYIKGMHGQFRIPTLLKRADQLCREEAKKHASLSDASDSNSAIG